MSFNNEVDYIPNPPIAGKGIDISETKHEQSQKRKWQVLIGTFLFVLICANIVIWSQEPVYQSQAIMQFSYKSKTDHGFAELAQQQINIHQQRLKSNRVLSSVSRELKQNHGLMINVQTLSNALSIQTNLSGRIISLIAEGSEPQTLKPILDALSKVYLQLVESETQVNNDEELQVTDEQLKLLEVKIANQQKLLDLFAIENDIGSLERDKNRVVSQTRNLGLSLDQTLAAKAQAKASLNSLTESINSGQYIIRASDKREINATKERLEKLKSKLSALAEKYTQAYLERDPNIVYQQQEVAKLEKQLEEQIQTSHLGYLQDIQRNVDTANDKAQQLNTQLIEQNKLVQTFSQKLEQYKRLDEVLKTLKKQAQSLKVQQVTQDVSKPFKAKITLIEPAFEPNFAVGPNYQLYTLLSMVVAAIISIVALLLFSFIVRQKSSSSKPDHLTVIPSQANNIGSSGLSYAQDDHPYVPTAGLPPDSSKPTPRVQTLRLLSINECQALFAVANNQGKALIGLILSGVSFDELSKVKKADFIQNYSELQINGQFSRIITLQKELTEALVEMCGNLKDEQIIWSNIKSVEDIIQLPMNIGHDAQLAFPEQLSLDVLRHTYLTFLASQGARLNDIEKVAGYTSPSDLALYRNVNQQGKLHDLEQIQTQFPFIATS